MMNKYNFFEIMDEYISEDALIDQICDDQLEQSDIDSIKMRTLQKIGEKKMKKKVNKGLIGVAAAVLLLAVGTGGYCKTNDITFTQLFSGKQGEAVLPTETPTHTDEPTNTETSDQLETPDNTEKENVVEEEAATKNMETAVPQENAKNLTVYFGDKECPVDGHLKENLDIYEENGIIAKIGENYYLGTKKIDRLDVEGVFESQYNDEKGCYEEVMVKKPIYGDFPIVEIGVGLINEKAKKVIVVYEFSANQASAMNCFPTWKMEKEEDSAGGISFADYPKESYVINQENTDDLIGCGTIISDGTIVDVSKYEKVQEEYDEDYCWDVHYVAFPSVEILSAALAEQMTKYMDGEIQSLSTIKIWEGGINITVASYVTGEKAWKQYQKMLQE